MDQGYQERLAAAAGDGRHPSKIAFVQACWHKEIVDQCRHGFAEEIAKLGYRSEQLQFFEVPGSFELPLHVKILAESGRFDAIVAAGFIVNGGIYRHEFVADTVIDSLMRVQLHTNVPVISAVLTPQNFHEHEDHRRFFLAHFIVKGAEAAAACVKTIENVGQAKLLGKTDQQ